MFLFALFSCMASEDPFPKRAKPWSLGFFFLGGGGRWGALVGSGPQKKSLYLE